MIEQAKRIYIKNAGMVILRPFLNAYFKYLGLVNENGFIDGQRRAKAVYLLEYSVSGRAIIAEEDLSLNKILCGLDVGAEITTDFSLTDEEVSETYKLLSVVIQQWNVLQGTSAEGLRSTFLMRAGVLQLTERGYELHVERHTMDVLLDRIPWSISIVQLPWMPQPLYITW